MPMACLHMGQRRISRFAADVWEPNLRIKPRTAPGLRAALSIFLITNCTVRKKMAKFVGELRDQERAALGSVSTTELTSVSEKTKLSALFRGIAFTMRILAIRISSIDGGWSLRGGIAFVAYDRNSVVAQVHEQLLRLLFR